MWRPAAALVAIALAAACRLGFNEPNTDGPPTVGEEAPQPIPRLPCGSPTRTQFGANSGIDELIATPTSTGYAVVAVINGILSASTFALVDDGLNPELSNVTIDDEVADVADATCTSAGLTVAAVFDGSNPPVGTKIFPLDAALRPTTTVTRNGELGGTHALSKSGTSNKIAFASSPGPTVNDPGIVVRQFDVAGFGPGLSLSDGLDVPAEVSIRPAHTGFVVAWVATSNNPDQVQLRLIDEEPTPIASATIVNTESDTPDDQSEPHVVWRPSDNRYLVAWHERSDEVWVQPFSAGLAPLGIPKRVTIDGHTPRVAVDDGRIWVAWLEHPIPGNGNVHRVVVAEVEDDGDTPVRRSLDGTPNGNVGDHTVTAFAGQAVVVWAEVGGMGADLYFDPLCE